MQKSTKHNWGFDLKQIDSAIRPQDDFYHYANGGWIKKNTIPPEESRWGSFIILRHTTEKQLHAMVLDMLEKKSHKKGSPEQLIADFYTSAMNLKRRNALGTKPLTPWLSEVRAISSKEELLETIGRMHHMGIAVPWEFYIDQDSKNSAKYLLHLTQDGIGMPDRDYYLSQAAEQTRVREAYVRHIKKILALSGMKKSAVLHAADIIIKIETRLARASMPKEDTRDSEKTYHKRTPAQLQKEVPQVSWTHYFKQLGASGISELIVAQPDFFKEVGRMIESISLEDWRVYLEWHIINESAPLLSEAFVRTSFDFYGKTLTGSKQMRSLWRRSLGAVNGNLGEALGKMYVERHFTRQAKQRMEVLVKDLFVAYEDRIKSLDWMTPETKKKAAGKLHSMNYKIGYPVKFDTYKGVEVRPDDFFGNITRSHEYHHKKGMRRLKKPVDRKEWFMTPQTVNAYCQFNLNEIVFPAAILQPPFFDLTGDDAVNYGAIGAVIGHEITHGFDDQGSKFDAKGNMRTWWSTTDRNRFTKKSEVMVKQFNAYEVAPGVKANGQLTLGENIADLGGASIAFDAYMKRLKITGRKDIDGFTPEQRFFLGFAQAEQEIARPEFTKMANVVDPHSAAPLRVNGPVSNLEAFYKAFSLKKGDKLYRDPGKRAKIW